MKNENKFIIAILIGALLLSIGVICEIKNETPEQRTARIMSDADRECGQMEGLQYRDCYEFYQVKI